jgi:hypothetical protein
MRKDNRAANRGDNRAGQGHRQQSISNRPYPVKANTDKPPYKLRSVEVPCCADETTYTGACWAAHTNQK